MYIALLCAANILLAQPKINGSPNTIVPSAPAFTDAVEEGFGTLDLPYVENVIYRINGWEAYGGDYHTYDVGTTVIVTVEPAQGYSFPDGAVATWTHTFGYAPPRPPSFHEEADDEYYVRIPAAAIAIYRINGSVVAEGDHPCSSGVVTVTAEPMQGHSFSAGTVTLWTHTFGANEPPPPVNNAAFIASGSIPSPIAAGQTVTVSVTMQNTGNTTWNDNSTRPYSLGSQNPQDNTTWRMDRVSIGTVPVAPGETKAFSFAITAPSTPGSYNFQWRMVQAGVEWFGASSSNAIIQVVSGSITLDGQLHHALGLNPNASTRVDAGELEADAYTPAR